MTTPLTPIPARIKDLKGDVAQVDPADGQALIWDNDSSAWTPGGIAVDQVAGLEDALNAKANDSAVVHKTGTESIAGTKTFTDLVRVGTESDPINDTNAGIVAARNQHTVIYALGTGFPGLARTLRRPGNLCCLRPDRFPCIHTTGNRIGQGVI